MEDSGDSSEGNGLEELVDKVNNSEELSEINEWNDFKKSLKALNTVAFCCAGDKLSDEDFSDMDEEGKSSFNDEEICINTSVSKSRKPIHYQKNIEKTNDIGMVNDDLSEDEDTSSLKKSRFVRKKNLTQIMA